MSLKIKSENLASRYATSTRRLICRVSFEGRSLVVPQALRETGDVRYIAFASDASNLVGGEDTNNYRDIFVHDRGTGMTSRVSVNSTGTTQGNADCFRLAISADGRFIVFETEASSLIGADTNGYADIFSRGPLH